MWDYIKSEPAVIVSLVQAVIALAITFGLDLSNEQVGLLLMITAIVLGIVTRQTVTPNVNVLKRKQ